MSPMTPEEVAAQLVTSTFLKFIMAFHTLTSLAGILALLFLEWSRKTHKLLAHKSLKLLMDAHAFWTFILCLSMFVNSVKNLHAHLTFRHPSDILVPASTCQLHRSPAILAVYGSIFSQMAMAAERYRASTNLSNYEYTNKTTGHLLNAIHIAAVIFFWYVHIVIYRSDWIATHCTLVNPSREAINTVIAFFVFLCEVTTLLSFKLLLSRNIRLRDNKDAGLTLSERYQLTENIRMLKVMNPIIRSHTSLGMVGASFYLTLKIIFPSPGMYPLIEETVNMLDLQGICIPIIFILRLRAERRNDQQIHDVNTATAIVMTAHHTRAIEEGW